MTSYIIAFYTAYTTLTESAQMLHTLTDNVTRITYQQIDLLE
jgi:hypothetical protein